MEVLCSKTDWHRAIFVGYIWRFNRCHSGVLQEAVSSWGNGPAFDFPSHPDASLGATKSISTQLLLTASKSRSRRTAEFAMLKTVFTLVKKPRHLLYSVSKKTGSLRLIWHYFTSSQHLLIILVDLIQCSTDYVKKFFNWLRTSFHNSRSVLTVCV